MLGHGAGIGYMGPGPRMGPTDNFSLVTGPDIALISRPVGILYSQRLGAALYGTVIHNVYYFVFIMLLTLLLESFKVAIVV